MTTAFIVGRLNILKIIRQYLNSFKTLKIWRSSFSVRNHMWWLLLVKIGISSCFVWSLSRLIPIITSLYLCFSVNCALLSMGGIAATSDLLLVYDSPLSHLSQRCSYADGGHQAHSQWVGARLVSAHRGSRAGGQRVSHTVYEQQKVWGDSKGILFFDVVFTIRCICGIWVITTGKIPSHFQIALKKVHNSIIDV